MKVLCVWVEANVPYSHEYVYRLRSMVRRHLPASHEFVCLTDRPHLLPGVECVRVAPTENGTPGWWSKLELFNPRHGLEGEGLYLDLDVLLLRDISPIAEWPSLDQIALLPHEGSFEGRLGRAVVKRYNSSVMRLRLGATPQLWEKFSTSTTRRLWGDQDWIGEQMPSLPTMPLAWFPRLSSLVREDGRPPAWPDEALVVLCKRPKNHVIAESRRWFDEMWN